MNTTTQIAAGILSKFKNVKETATGWQASCPAHQDNRPSLSISVTDQKVLLHCFAGCETADILVAAGLDWADLHMDEGHQLRIVANYDYQDESGDLLYQVVRYQPKDFKVRRPDGNGGWIYNINDTRRVPYRLPQLREAEHILILEGEKDADNAAEMRFAATTNPSGAGKWRPEYNEYFRGKKVRIIPDADEVGWKHAQAVACQLFPVAKDVKVVRLPAGKDLSEWRDNGGTREHLIQIMKATPTLTAATVEAWRNSNTSKDGFRLTKLGDLLDEPEEKVSWTAEGLLPIGGVSLLVAKPKTGKSTLARGCAMAVARGKKFLGRRTVPGKVVYLALEEKRAEVRKHFTDMGADGSEQIFIHCATAPQDAVTELRELVKRERPALVIIDPILRLARLKDANDYAQVNLAMEPFIAMAREFEAHLMLVYHLGKGERSDATDQILGSTAFYAAVDTALIMKRSERYRTIQSSQRYGEDMPETVLEFDAVRRRITLGAPKAEAEIMRVEEEILAVLKKSKTEMDEKEIDAAVARRNKLKRSALRSLVKNGRVSRTGEGKKGAPYLYAIS
jgi:putative DNA primase/helicase